MIKLERGGFTIVELLIVIVVIATLAAISVVAYNGIQQRASNTKTIAAVEAWAKAIQMYYADHSSYPTQASCLGENYGMGVSGNETSGGECRQDTSTTGALTVNATFMNNMSNYISNKPTPSFKTAYGASEYPFYRGAYFYAAYSSTPARIDYVVEGASTECRSIAGAQPATPVTYTQTDTRLCRINFSAN